MYKRRDAALAELVANAWDAGATEVSVTLPYPSLYDASTSSVVISDNGHGMSDEEVEDAYLVIGRNRRAEGHAETGARKVMGRKGIGKLAGFGLAQSMRLETWREGVLTSVAINASDLKTDARSVANLSLPGAIGPVPDEIPFASGTRITLSGLKHVTAMDPQDLRHNLARRFSRLVRGNMAIIVNEQLIDDAPLTYTHREPAEGESEERLDESCTVRWWAGFSETVLNKDLQGFAILVRGKTAQAPPFFFNVESTASGQHGTKYLTGVIEADFLDDGTDDESDRISTDRQEVDWADPGAQALKKWGDALVRRLLIQHADRRGKRAQAKVSQNPLLSQRLDALDKPSREQAKKFINQLGSSDASLEKVEPLADTIIRAYEYRQFHDYIEQIDEISDDPDELERTLELLRGWKVLESRAVLEVVKGRIDIVDKFYHMIVEDAPETASSLSRDNMHDLIADYPWLVNPEWQVFAEEKRITTQLREWGTEDIADPEDRSRYDFLALAGDGQIIVIEIKRAGHAVELKDLHQIDSYAGKLQQARDNVHMAFITGDKYALPDRQLRNWRDRDDIDLLTWREIHERTKSFYEHYRAVLEGDVRNDDFDRKARELARTRSVLDTAAYRGTVRKEGIGPQDVNHEQS
nr:ATP-binding protein [Micromonospora jinlongensis]